MQFILIFYIKLYIRAPDCDQVVEIYDLFSCWCEYILLEVFVVMSETTVNDIVHSFSPMNS